MNVQRERTNDFRTYTRVLTEEEIAELYEQEGRLPWASMDFNGVDDYIDVTCGRPVEQGFDK